MNQEPVQVLKQKHPGRVAGGKKLAEFNRKRKEEMLKLVGTNQIPDQIPNKEPRQEPNKELVSSFNVYSAGFIILVIGGGVVGHMFYTSKKAPVAEVKLPVARGKML